jgi:hypothetical protein
MPNIPGTVVHYLFQDTLKDASGNGLDIVATDWGSPTNPGGTEQYAALDTCLQAFKFNGATKLLAPLTSLTQLTGAYTVQFLMHQATGTGGNQCYFTCDDPSRNPAATIDREGALYAWLWNNGAGGWPGGAQPYYTSQGYGSDTSPNYFNPTINPFTPPPNAWGIGGSDIHHYAWRANADGSLNGFVDGVKYVGQARGTGNVSNGAERLYIGGSHATFSDVMGNGCLMADFRMLDYARADADILSDANNALTATCGAWPEPTAPTAAATYDPVQAARIGSVFRYQPQGWTGTNPPWLAPGLQK